MILLALSAAFVGLVHCLAPGHWLPVVLMVKGRRWPMRTAIAGALVAASGHVIVSLSIGLLSLVLGAHFLAGASEERLESYAGLMLLAFGLGYAAYSFRRHSHCHGHEHHGPRVDRKKAPFLFLFSLGLSPCVAVLPVFAAATTRGSASVLMTMIAFSGGVVAALVSATLLVSLGVMKLDHPIFEHYGDVITGLGVAAMGVIFYFFPI